MNLRQLIRDEFPRRCGVNPEFGKVAEMILDKEIEDDTFFNHNTFIDARERAAGAVPYKPNNYEQYERCLDIAEYAILKHRRDKHGEDNIRTAELEIMPHVQAELEAASFWGT